MANTPGFDRDIFISFSPEDNHRKDQRYAFALAAGLAQRIPDLELDFTKDADGPPRWFDDSPHIGPHSEPLCAGLRLLPRDQIGDPPT